MEKDSHKTGLRNSTDARSAQAKNNMKAPMASAIEQNSNPIDATRAAAPLLLVQMEHCEWLHQQLDRAFGGMALDPNDSPLSAKNRRRFRTYFAMQKPIMRLLFRLLDEWMRIHGVDPVHPQQPWEPPVIGGGTGPRPGLPVQGKSGRQPIVPDQPFSISPETALLAKRIEELGRAAKAPSETNAASGTSGGKGQGKRMTKQKSSIRAAEGAWD